MNFKRPNKPTVFKAGSDSENEDNPERKIRKTGQPARNSADTPKQKPESVNKILNIPVKSLNKKLSQWPYLEIRGPYHNFHFLFNNKTIKNQLLCKLIRQLLKEIHWNAIDYKMKTIPTIIKRFDETTPTIEDAITIAEEMCRTVFRFRDSCAYFVDLYEDNMISPIKELLLGKELNVDCNTEILQRLKSICKSKKVNVSNARLQDMRNGFVNCIFQLAIDLLPCIFSIDVVLFPGKLSSFRAADFAMSENFHKAAEWYSKLPQLRPISHNLLNRHEKPASLWLSIPCELEQHLLEHVIEYGLIELLPIKARSMLYRWILNVRKRMRNRLTKGDLTNKIEQYMSAVDKNEKLSTDDTRVEGVISAVLENALNSKGFKVFDGEWKNFTLNFIKTMDRHQFLDISLREDVIRDVCRNMHPASLQRLSSCFSNSENDKTLLSHTLHQVLHFTIRLALNTLRHVFRFSRHGGYCMRFDGEIENVVTDFSRYSRNTSPETDFIVAQKTDNTPQSALQNASPLASRRDDFYQRMPPSDYRCSSIQSTCNSNYTASGPASFHQFEPEDTSSGGDVKKSFFSCSTVAATMKRPKTEVFNDSSLSEEKEGELPKARELRQPSVSSFTQIDDFEGVPREWIIEYKAALDTNQKLLAELDRAKERLTAISK